jgi:hypothetical protein
VVWFLFNEPTKGLETTSFPRSPWECRPPTLRVFRSSKAEDAERPRLHSHGDRGSEFRQASWPCVGSSFLFGMSERLESAEYSQTGFGQVLPFGIAEGLTPLDPAPHRAFCGGAEESNHSNDPLGWPFHHHCRDHDGAVSSRALSGLKRRNGFTDLHIPRAAPWALLARHAVAENKESAAALHLPRAAPWAFRARPFRAEERKGFHRSAHTQGDALGCADAPLQGVERTMFERGAEDGCFSPAPHTLLMTSEAFWPPKPKLLESAVRMRISLAVLGT